MEVKNRIASKEGYCVVEDFYYNWKAFKIDYKASESLKLERKIEIGQ